MFIKPINQQRIDMMADSFCIHFDLDGNKHEIPILQSIIIEQSIYDIVTEINKYVFNDDLQIQISVFADEKGGLIKNIIFYIGTGLTVARAFVESSTGNAIIKGLTGKERTDYVEEKTVLVKDSIIGFLKNENSELNNCGVNYNEFYKAYDAKNKFYQTCLSNPDVRGLGFDKTNRFPVQRNEFKFRITDLKEHTSDIEPVDKFHDLIVISHINTVEDKKLARQVKDKKVKKRFDVYMGDQGFYEFFLSAPFYIINMTVKVRYYLKRSDEGEILIDKKEIITVYKYNDTMYFDMPKDIIIESAPRAIKDEEIVLEENEKHGPEGTLFEGLMQFNSH